MPTLGQIRGALLEEVLLYLLEGSGYQTVNRINKNDKTLCKVGAGLAVKGRGDKHQIDAIADFVVTAPFSHPQRLLVEAKCLDSKGIGIEVVRNAVGVLKDVCEFWPADSSIHKNRYHYQYAIFSSSGYSSAAQRYAYAQDIFLIALAESNYFRGVYDALNTLLPAPNAQVSRRNNIEGFKLAHLRRWFRRRLHPDEIWDRLFETGLDIEEDLIELAPTFLVGTGEVVRAARSLSSAYIGMMSRRFPILLIPDDEGRVRDAIQQTIRSESDTIPVRIHWDDTAWYINHNGQRLFSFELPSELFLRFAKNGELDPLRALDMKREFMMEIQLSVSEQNRFRTLRLVTDRQWLNRAMEEVKSREKRRQERRNDDGGLDLYEE